MYFGGSDKGSSLCFLVWVGIALVKRIQIKASEADITWISEMLDSTFPTMHSVVSLQKSIYLWLLQKQKKGSKKPFQQRAPQNQSTGICEEQQDISSQICISLL